MRIRNFGHNISFSPRKIYRPSSEEALLEILARHSADQIRARGSLHSWSGAPATDGVMIEMEDLAGIDVSGELHAPRVTVGAGCRLEALVDELNRHNVALPTNGAVLEQSISGAVSTATHGSGNKSLSSFVKRVRLATLAADGKPALYEIDGTDRLLAGRCAVGALGIITELELELTHSWAMEERFEKAGSFEEVLAGEEEWPLQQFFLLPYSWSYYVFRRRRAEREPSWLKSHLYKGYNVVATDAVAHALFKGVVTMQKAGAGEAVRGFFRYVLPRLLVTGVTVAGDSTMMSTLNHQWFRHLEMEIFVPDDRLARSLEIIRATVSFYGGDSDEIPDDVMETVSRTGLKDYVLARRGWYTHHYPIFMRRVLHDDALISMSSRRADERWWYSISLFSYMQPRDRFFDLADTILTILNREFGARPHWGKYHRLVREDLEPLYPGMERFREVARQLDPLGAFTNDYTERAIGLGRRDR